MERFYKTGEFARLIGVSAVTLRSWDEKGLLKPHHVTPFGYRYYSEQQLQDYFNSKSSKGGDVDERR